MTAQTSQVKSQPKPCEEWCDRWTFRCYHCNGDCDHHYLTNDTIKVEEDVERYLGLSVLGSIPYSEKESRSKKQKSRKRR